MTVSSNFIPKQAETLDMPVKEAKVSKAGDRFFLTVGKKKVEIPTGPKLPKADLAKLVGKKVGAVFSRVSPRVVVAIALKPPRVVLCYVPAPDVIRRLAVAEREMMIRELAEQKAISPVLQKILNASLR